MTALWVTLALIAGIFIGYWLRGFSVDDLEQENLALREVGNKRQIDLDNANVLVSDHSKSSDYWRARYEDLVEAVKKKAAESKTKGKKAATK